MFTYHPQEAFWLNEPAKHIVDKNTVALTTMAGTDLWERTYYGFQKNNGHALLCSTDEPFFSFSVKVETDASALYDQAGILLYADDFNWAKCSTEFRKGKSGWLGSVVTNRGFSDWASTDIAYPNVMWYRLSRRKSDFCLETSLDGKKYRQIRMFHFFDARAPIDIGVYACSPDKAGTFTARFSDFKTEECRWKPHNK